MGAPGGATARIAMWSLLVSASAALAFVQPSRRRPPGLHYASTKSIVDSMYDNADTLGVGVRCSVVPPHDDERMRELSPAQATRAWTYGELSYRGAEVLWKTLALDPATTVFCDLGSGVGRLCIQAHLQWGVAASIGVELSQHRHGIAEKALQRLRDAGHVDPARRLELRNGNALVADVAEATLVYLACTCWDDEFVAALLRHLEAEASDLQWVVATESFEEKFGLRPRFLELRETVVLSQSWDDEWPVYIYRATRE